MNKMIIGVTVLAAFTGIPAIGANSFSIGWNEFSTGPQGNSFIWSNTLEKQYPDDLTQGVYSLGIISGTPYNTKFAAYSRVIYDEHLYGGLGISYAEHETPPRLTTKWNFYFTAGVRLSDSWSAEYHHLSNGGTGGQNLGMNMFMLTYSW